MNENEPNNYFVRLWVRSTDAINRLAALYHPKNLRQKGLWWSAGLLAMTVIFIFCLLGWYWSKEPETIDVRSSAVTAAETGQQQLVVGYTFTNTLLELSDRLLYKRGGYLTNDKTPPGIFLDNIPNWEFGVLVMLRDAAAALRNHLSRSQTQSIEDKELAIAEPQFNINNNSWIFPSTESEYEKGRKAIMAYLSRLASAEQKNAQFFARADNLRRYLEVIEQRLGSLSQRLSASVGQIRINTDLAGDSAATQSSDTPGSIMVKTPWLELDDVFYEARGATWALYHILQAVEIDFREILRKKNALVSLRQIIRELEATQNSTLSPVILNGGGFGLFSNYSLTMANYIARANAAIIDLRELLQQG